MEHATRFVHADVSLFLGLTRGVHSGLNAIAGSKLGMKCAVLVHSCISEIWTIQPCVQCSELVYLYPHSFLLILQYGFIMVRAVLFISCPVVSISLVPFTPRPQTAFST